ncbi:CRISPR-associated protein (Cas_Csd1) [Candidatus Methylomirabilis lanthanidiphila]|uniref:CRISPR-associated protein (Cas_Csd1) n=1 Tax=Candidatus Methylomirabilis lanthanidiphila TaxID=2211376 RepID=A0A564ZNN0_9BACT|nr:type I-C CRISPR-associated protein Cas8c/Csd1 [Candidatus Methylomirabilis lanthanidiphila]VUZ86148.1 CRISPR-associated protein (Cas_Csd1) [Candidatus Methylomirabilis lanthanidiphila]
MLHHLIEYAQRHGITAEPGFSPKDVRWAIVCDASGRFTEVIPLGEGKRGRPFSRCPDLTQPELVGGDQPRSHFLVETAEVVALHRKDDADKATLKKAEQKHTFFVEMLRSASDVMPELDLAARMLGDPEQLTHIRDHLNARKAKSTDKVTIYVRDGFPVESEAWHDWWRRFRVKLGDSPQKRAKVETKSSPQGQMICFLTGESVVPAKTHEKIRGLAGVGGLAAGDALVCFDKDSFTSYGLKQSANAAISEAAAKGYREALNALIRDHQKKLPSAMLVHWFKERVPETDDPVSWLVEPPEQEERSAQQAARELLNAIEAGRRPGLSANRYLAVTLSGAAGRVMIRSWMEGPFQELITNVSAWFEDLEIVHREGHGPAFTPKFLAVVGALARELDEVPPSAAPSLLHAALGGRGRAIPSTLLAQATRRASLDFVTGQSPNHARMGLIKAFHIRNPKGGVPMSPYLNEDHPNPAYHCGRLLAVLAGLQRSALGDVGAGVVQRYYTATSQAPALMIGRLVANAKNHLNKLEPGLIWWYENEIAAVMGHIGERLPRTLDLEGQSLFALGYYQQLAHSRAGKRGDNAKKKEESNV